MTAVGGTRAHATHQRDVRSAMPHAAAHGSAAQRQPHRDSPAARSSSLGRRASGERPLDMKANTSSRWSASTTTPARLFAVVSVPVFARTTPAPPRPARREAVFERAVAARHRQPGRAAAAGTPVSVGPCAGAAAAPAARPAAGAGTRSCVDSPLPSTIVAAAGGDARLASAPPAWPPPRRRTTARRRGRRGLPGEHLGEHVVRLLQQRLDELGRPAADDHRAQHLGAGRGGARRPQRPGPAPAASRTPARPAAAGSGTAGAVLLGGVDAPAVEHQRGDRGDVAAGDVAGVPARREAAARGSGVVSITLGAPAAGGLLDLPARSVSRAASG